MKRKIKAFERIIILGMVLMFGLSGCGSNQEEQQDNSRITQTPQMAEDAKEAFLQDSVNTDQQLEEILQEQEAPSPVPEKKEMKASYTFSYQDTSIGINCEAAPILEALGKEQAYFEAPSCAFEGIDKTYTYPGFELTTYQADDGDRVFAILLTDDSVKTPEGAYLFMEESRIPVLLGEATIKSQNQYTYEAGEMQLILIVEEGEVTSIEYRMLQ